MYNFAQVLFFVRPKQEKLKLAEIDLQTANRRLIKAQESKDIIQNKLDKVMRE